MFCYELQTLCNNTRVARDRDVFMVSTVVNAPAVVSTLLDTRVHTIAVNVVQPNLSTTGTVALTNKPSTVSVCRVIHSK